MNKNVLIRWITVLVIGLIIFLAMLLLKGDYNLYGYMNAFFLPGAILIGVGGLSWIGQTGQYDIFAYGFISVFHRAFKYKEPMRDKDLAEYKERKQQERIYKGGFINFLPYFGIGAIFLIVSIILFIIFKNM